MYDEPFFITGPVSNNAFNYERRINKKIFIPALKEGVIEDVQVGDEIVFEDFDDDGNLKSCKGLKSFIKLKNRPVYIFDNHNHAFAFWHLEAINQNIPTKITLIHIDQHKDTRRPESFLTPEEAKDPSRVFKYTNTVLNVGNFIPAAQKTGIINKVTNIDSEPAIESIQKNPPATPYILDIDLDFFAPELDYIENNSKIRLIKKLLPNALITTIATSPFFIGQELAIKYLRKIFS
jgi:hypothetical protein